MIVAAHQPNYIPWIGYFYKLLSADVMVVLDQVQFTKEGFQNRNRIKTAQGANWLTIPVITKGRFGQATRDVELNPRIDWRAQHLNALQTNYGRAPFFRRYFTDLRHLYSQPWDRLVDVNLAFLRYIAGELGVNTPLVLASELGVSGKATAMLVDACQKVGGSIYLSGFGGQNYMEQSEFDHSGITCVYYDFRHPVYSQLWGEFTPNLTALDLLFNCGPEAVAMLEACAEQATTAVQREGV